MDRVDGHHGATTKKKEIRQSERPFTAALFLLRCLEIGLRLEDLDEMTVGTVYDLFIERARDKEEWDEEATLDDIRNF